MLVKAGDAVAAGQTMVVLEAMKMENELAAPRAGRIAEVRCAEGSAVEAGKNLISSRSRTNLQRRCARPRQNGTP